MEKYCEMTLPSTEYLFFLDYLGHKGLRCPSLQPRERITNLLLRTISKIESYIFIFTGGMLQFIKLLLFKDPNPLPVNSQNDLNMPGCSVDLLHELSAFFLLFLALFFFNLRPFKEDSHSSFSSVL